MYQTLFRGATYVAGAFSWFRKSPATRKKPPSSRDLTFYSKYSMFAGASEHKILKVGVGVGVVRKRLKVGA